MSLFLYKYFYSFFVLHLSDNTEGRNNRSPGLATIAQISISLFIPLVFSFKTVVYYFDIPYEDNRIGIIIALLLFLSLVKYYYYTVLKVDKETGLSERYTVEVSKNDRVFFWVLWIVSILLPTGLFWFFTR